MTQQVQAPDEDDETGAEDLSAVDPDEPGQPSAQDSDEPVPDADR